MSEKDMENFRLRILSKEEKRRVVEALVASSNSEIIKLKDDKGKVVRYDPDNMVIRAGVRGELWKVVYNEKTRKRELWWECESLKKVCANVDMMENVRSSVGLE